MLDTNSAQQAAVSMRLGKSYLIQKDYIGAIAAYQNVKEFYAPQNKPYIVSKDFYWFTEKDHKISY